MEPIVVCDCCKKQINRAIEGNYEYKFDEETWETDGEVFFIHKTCSFEWAQSKGGLQCWLSDEITNFLMYLENNLK